MKRLKICLILISFFTVKLSLAQVNQLLFFNGGELSAQFKVTQNLIAPVSGSQLIENPALVAFSKKPQMKFCWIPPIRYDLSQYGNVTRQLNQQVDQIVVPFRTPTTAFKYPHLAVKIGVNSSLQSLGMVVPVEGSVFSIGYRNLLDFQMDLLGKSHDATIETSVGETSYIFNSENDMILDFQLSGQVLQFGIARNLHKQWLLGFQVTGYYVQASATGFLNTQGSFYDGAEIYFFNDADAGWQNHFFQRLNAGYQGTGIGLKYGAAFQPNSQWLLDLLIELIPNFSLSGDLDLVQYKFSALNTAVLFENISGNVIEPDQIDTVRPTRTYAINNQIDRRIVMRLPSQISFGSTLIRESWRFHSRLSIYLRELSFHYLNTRAGLKPIFAFKLGATLPFLKIDTGFILLKEIREGLDKHIDVNRPKFKLPVPILSFRSGFTVSQHYQVGGSVTVLPVPVFHLNFTTSL